MVGRQKGKSVLEDGLRTLWFLRGVSSQYFVRQPLGIGGELLAVADQG